MLAAGWHPQVVDLQRYFVFDSQPGSTQWRIFEEACKELSKLEKSLESKVAHPTLKDKKAELQLRREAARLAIEDDKQLRHSKFTYADDHQPSQE